MALKRAPVSLSNISSPKSIDVPGDKLLSPSEAAGILFQASPRNSLVDLTIGQEYEFVEPPPPDFYCPVTFELLVDPHQTECCGNHISSQVADRLKAEGKPCPVCKEAIFNTHTDKHYRRRVLDLRVCCPHEGCNWVGEVRYHKSHVEECPKRSWSCQYCDYSCTHDEGESVHWPECKMFPEPCPNQCEVHTVARKNIELHRTVCSLEPVACGLSEYGCQAIFPRKDLAKHTKENEGQHLISLAIHNYKQLKSNKESMVELRRNVQQLQQSVQSVHQEISALKLKTGHIEHHVAGGSCLSCTVHSFPNFSQLKLSEKVCESQPFRVQNYLFNFRIRCYNPPFDMVVAFLGLFPSSDDDDLVWPAKISCQLEQVNQVGDTRHRKYVTSFIWNKEERGTWKNIDTYEMKYTELQNKKSAVNYLVNDTLVYRLHLDITP